MPSLNFYYWDHTLTADALAERKEDPSFTERDHSYLFKVGGTSNLEHYLSLIMATKETDHFEREMTKFNCQTLEELMSVYVPRMVQSQLQGAQRQMEEWAPFELMVARDRELRDLLRDGYLHVYLVVSWDGMGYELITLTSSANAPELLVSDIESQLKQS